MYIVVKLQLHLILGQLEREQEIVSPKEKQLDKFSYPTIYVNQPTYNAISPILIPIQSQIFEYYNTVLKDILLYVYLICFLCFINL